MALPAPSSDQAPSAEQRMPRSRRGTTTSFHLAGAEVHLIANADAQGSLGEVFARFGKGGSTAAGLVELLSIAVSLGLQHGVPLERYVARFAGQRFEPMGPTDDPDVPHAGSVGDYLARRLAHDWLDVDARRRLDLLTAEEEAELPADAYAPTPLRRAARP